VFISALSRRVVTLNLLKASARDDPAISLLFFRLANNKGVPLHQNKLDKVYSPHPWHCLASFTLQRPTAITTAASTNTKIKWTKTTNRTQGQRSALSNLSITLIHRNRFCSGSCRGDVDFWSLSNRLSADGHRQRYPAAKN